MKKFFIFLLTLFIFILVFIGSGITFYLYGLPKIVNSQKFISLVQDKVKQYTDLDLYINSPTIVTNLNKNITVKVKNLTLNKQNNNLLILNNIDTDIKLGKTIVLNKLFADYIYADIDNILAAIPENNTNNNDIKFDFFKAILYIKNLELKYNFDKNSIANLVGKDIVINGQKENKKDIHFNLIAKLSKNNKTLTLSAKDENKVYISNSQLNIDNINLKVDKSNVLLNLIVDNNYKYLANIFSNNFQVNDIVTIINSKLLDETTSELLTYFNDIKGRINFDISIKENELNGYIDVKNLFFKLKYIENLPVLFTNGNIKLSKDEIKLNNFKGIYNNKRYNKLDFEGNIKDYWHSFDTNIVGNAIVTNDFSVNYLSKMAGYPIGIKGNADTRIFIKSKYNKIDLLWLYRFKKGSGFLIGGEEFGQTDKEQALVSNMHIQGPILNIEDLNYFLGSPRDKDFNKIPILSFYGNVDLAHNCNLLNFGFKIPEYLTSNFINMLLKQDVLRHGTVKGNMEYINKGKVPILKGELNIDKVGVPSQRMFIRTGKLYTNNNLINFSAEGKYKRSDYQISGSMVNEVKTPIIIKNLDLTVDNIDVERFMAAANNSSNVQDVNLSKDNSEQNENEPTFDLSTLIVEKGKLNLVKGFYKDIKFDNVLADLTFDKNQILKIKSNRFNFAEGHSGTKIVCDLKNQLYSIKLGVKEINSDLIATTLLGMSKEITGKASGFIDLNTDKTLKMNGKMGFLIKDGSIAKIGLFEYVLKFTSIFRNPLVTISPNTFYDFVNVPNGDFEQIRGTLDITDNVVNKISITSSSPLMSSYIAGRYNLENRDTALRIYIKYSNKNKGAYGILRNLSLNSLANRVPFGAKTSNNYYEREIEKIPPLQNVDEKDCQIYLTKVDGDLENNNFISFLKKLK
jgi:hypothetical protein